MIPKSSLRILHLSAAVLSLSGIFATAQTSALRPTSVPGSAKAAPGYGKLPLSFEPNRGQTDASVQFLSHGSNYMVLLQPRVATLVLNHDDAPAEAVRAAHLAGKPIATTHASILMTLDDADARATMTPDRELPGYVTYMVGGDRSKWQVGIPTYAATRVAQAYPGVDLVYYGTEGSLEYDFIVKPNADPALIHLSISGAKAVLEPGGALRLQLASARHDNDIVFRKPTLYQQVAGVRQPIDGSFAVASNGEVSFRVGHYDHARELVIDPVISYGSYYGGSGEDEINGSALNASNQLYAVGQTFSPALPSGSGEFQPARSTTKNSNYHDAFVTKFSADGSTVLWTTYLAGSGDDIASAVAVNSADQAYIVGHTASCTSQGATNNQPGEFPFTADAIQTLCSPSYNSTETAEANGGSADAFLVKLSSDGKTELYGTPLGGSQDDFAESIVLDATGRPYIVGQTYSTQYYKCAAIGPHCGDIPAYPVDNHGNSDIGLSNYPTTSNAFYSNVAESMQYATTDPNSGNTGGPQDEQAFITVLSADMHSFVYSSLIGGGVIGGCGNGACNTNGIAVAVNAAGQAFIGGNTSSAHWPTTAGAFAQACSNAGASNSQCPMTGWLAGFDPSKSGAASLLFSTYMNGTSAGKDGGGNPLYPGGDVYGLAVDSTGNVIATGDTNANNFPTTSGTFEPACTQFGDGNGNTLRCASAFVTKLSPTGATVWSTYFGPKTQPGNFVIGNGVALDASDNVFIVGSSTSPTLPLVHPISTNPAQNDDAFVVELSPTASTELMGTFLGANGNLIVDNNSLHLDSSLNAYISGYQGYCTNCTITFPTTSGAFATNGLGGSSDGWVLKLITQQETSTTALQITPNAGAPGTSIAFTATITGLAGFATPTGTVSLTSGTTTLGTITLTNGTGTFTTTTLAAGTYNVVATYPGDSVYAASSTAQTVTIQYTPTVSLTATPSSANIGSSIVLKATVASASGTPSGTVYFMDGTLTLGSAMVAGGSASYSTSALTVGMHSITARYGGDSNFTGLTSAAQTVTINLIAPTVSLTASPATATIGAAIALGATVTGTGGSPGGSLKFLDGTTVLATVNLSSGAASYSATALAVGTHSITASYSGDGTFAPLVSAAQTVTINAIPPTITAALNPASLTIVHGSTGTSTLTVTPANGFAGTLTFSCGSLPTSASCGFSPASMTFTAASSTAQTSALTVSTNASIIGMMHTPPFHPGIDGTNRQAFEGVALAGLFLLPFAFRRRRGLRGRSLSLIAVAFFAPLALGFLNGCGGTSTGTPTAATTPPGSYTITINVAGAPSPTVINLQLTVQ